MKLHKISLNVSAVGAAIGIVAFLFLDRLDDAVDDLEPDFPEGRTPEQVAALTANIDEVIETVAYYAAFSVLLALLVIWAIVQRQAKWAVYSATAVVSLWWIALLEQNLSGIYWIGLQATWSTLLLIGFGIAIVNTAVAGVTVPHDLGRRRVPLIHVGAAIAFAAAAIGVTRLQNTTAVWACLAAIALSLVLQFFPTTRARSFWAQLSERRNLVFVAILGLGWLALVVGELDEGVDIVFWVRAAAGLLTTSFIVLFLVRTARLLRDRDDAARKSLADAKREAVTAKALLEARELAHQRSLRLATASHDIRQPIVALRTTMAAVMQAEPDDVKLQMNSAFDYMNKLADEYMTEAEGDALPVSPDEAGESVQTDLISQTLDRMFRSEAEAKGITLSVAVAPQTVAASPLKLMRVLTNLVSNAVAHTQSGAINVTGRLLSECFLFTVENTGQLPVGVTQDTLFDARVKGDTSDGSGLGLSIVRDVIADEGWMFDFCQTPQDTIRATLTVPVFQAD